MRLTTFVSILFTAGILFGSCSHKSRVRKERQKAWNLYTSLLTHEEKAVATRDAILTSLQALLSQWLHTEKREVTYRATILKGISSLTLSAVEGVTPPALFSQADFKKMDRASTKEMGRIRERISKLKALQKKRSSEKRVLQNLLKTAKVRRHK